MEEDVFILKVEMVETKDMLKCVLDIDIIKSILKYKMFFYKNFDKM